MSSVFAPAKKSIFNKPETNYPQTFALLVESYDIKAIPPFVKGKRLDNGDVVEVYLLKDEKLDSKADGKKGRPTIEMFTKPRKVNNDVGTVPGGVLLVERGIKQPDGSFGARWVRPLSHKPEEAEVMMVTAHVEHVKTTKGRNGQDVSFSRLTFLHDGKFEHLSAEMAEALTLVSPGRVNSEAELRAGLIELLNENVGAGVRVKVGEDFESLSISPRKGVAVEGLVNELMNNFTPEILEDIKNGQALCEIIPHSAAFAGTATRNLMADKSKLRIQKILDGYNQDVVGTDGKTRSVNVYQPTIAVLRLHDAGDDGQRRGCYFTHFEPLMTRPPVMGIRKAIDYASTSEFAPEPPRAAAAAKATAAPAADAGFDAGAGFDSGQTDDDLMGAMGGQEAPVSIAAEAAPEASVETAGEEAPRAVASRGRRVVR